MDQSQDRSDEGRVRERLSALLDGDSAALAALARAPRAADAATVFDELADSRGLDADWHLYHLIGDVMRSDDLASTAGHDRAFLAGFRERLAAEPVVLAPLAAGALDAVEASPAVAELPVVAPAANGTSRPVVARRRRSWLVAPVAAAAGFVAVAGMVTLLRGQGADEIAAPAGTLAAAGGALPAAVVPASVIVGGAATVVAAPGGGVVTGAMLRDSRIDRYLSAHRKVSNGAAVVLPGSTLRQVDVVVQGQQP